MKVVFLTKTGHPPTIESQKAMLGQIFANKTGQRPLTCSGKMTANPAQLAKMTNGKEDVIVHIAEDLNSFETISGDALVSLRILLGNAPPENSWTLVQDFINAKKEFEPD